MAFEEIGWNELEPNEGKYAFDEWENKFWNRAPAAGKHVVLRVYLDYPTKPIAVPKWLIAKGVKMTPYTEFGGGQSPDYSNPELQKSLYKFIKAFGARYDHDPRVDYVQLGLLGHWGEWHTYPHEDLFASPAVQQQVVAAMHAAFPDKPLMARNASYASCQLPWIGFHDDLIPQDTFGTEGWQFLPSMEKGGVASNWKVAPTGGEMVPGAAKQYLSTDWPLLMRSVKEAHFSWIGPYCPAMDSSLTNEEKSHMEELVRALGYQFKLTTLSLPSSLVTGHQLNLNLAGVNEGVAPLYANWPVKLALLDVAHHVSASWTLDADVRKWLPGPFQVTSTETVSVAPGKYSLAIGIINPASGKPEVHFANSLSESAGYTVLGSIEVNKRLSN
jgi:hypothetical protein